jgi:hypothetical protein
MKLALEVQSRKILPFRKYRKNARFWKNSQTRKIFGKKLRNENFSTQFGRFSNPEYEAKLQYLATSVRRMYKWLLFRRG